jgi:glycosyltransferase involved in cell wall biosynthesis
MKNQMNSYAGAQIDQSHIQQRILFVPGVLWGVSGITVHLLTLAKELIKYNWHVAIASDIPSNIDEAKEEANKAIKHFESCGVKHFLVPFSQLGLSATTIKNTFKFLIDLNAVIRQFKPDIIHVHSLAMCPYIRLISLIYKIPFVSTCHLQPSPDRLKKMSFMAYTYRHFIGNRVVAISSELKNTFTDKMRIPSNQVESIYNGVDETFFYPASTKQKLEARQELNLNPKSFVVALIGRLSSVKGHDVLLDALAILLSQGISVTALLAGKGYGNEEEEIISYAKKRGVINLLQFLGHADSRQVIWASDVIVLPSRREALPLVIIEAMLCGVVPVRTPASGALDQIEDGINGFIVPFDDPDALALKLKILLENEDLRLQMSLAALESAKGKFTTERMTHDILSLYNELTIKSNNINY